MPTPRMVTGLLVLFSYPTLTTFVLEHIFENGKIILSFGAVHIIIDCDKADIYSSVRLSHEISVLHLWCAFIQFWFFVKGKVIICCHSP